MRKKSPRLWLLSMAWLGLIRLRWWQNENKKRKKAHINTHNHKHIHLLRHLNEISLVIPFSFLMMEILKFLALSPTWISKQCMIACIYVVEMEGWGVNATQHHSLSTIKLVYMPNNKNNKYTSELQKRSVRAFVPTKLSDSIMWFTRTRLQLSWLSIFQLLLVGLVAFTFAVSFNESPTVHKNRRMQNNNGKNVRFLCCFQ